MLYYSIKTIHILTAAFLLASMSQSVILWRNKAPANKILWLNSYFVLPFLLFQLVSGFTIISLQKYNMTASWVLGSAVGFLIVILSWVSFLLLLLWNHSRRLQGALLIVCGLSLATMIFYMANQVP